MLLNAYGWWKVSQITYVASLVMFGLGGLALGGSVFTFAAGPRTRPQVQDVRHSGPAPVTVA